MIVAALNAALADPSPVARYAELVIEPVAWTPRATGEFMAQDRRMLTELIARTGIKLPE